MSPYYANIVTLDSLYNAGYHRTNVLFGSGRKKLHHQNEILDLGVKAGPSGKSPQGSLDYQPHNKSGSYQYPLMLVKKEKRVGVRCGSKQSWEPGCALSPRVARARLRFEPSLYN